MTVHITAANSIDLDTTAGNAFTGTLGVGVQDTLIVDANAFLISEIAGDGAHLTGSWTAIINGEVGAFGAVGITVIPNGLSDVSNVTVGRTGDVFGLSSGLLFEEAAGKITNLGTISGGHDGITGDSGVGSQVTFVNSGLIQGIDFGLKLFDGTHTIINSGTIRGGGGAIVSQGETHLTNSGTLQGGVALSSLNDTFTDFKKLGTVIKNGTVSGAIDLGGGDDHFNGGASSETVRDYNGTDVYKLGGGNDHYVAVGFGGSDGTDTVNGGSGVDTYDASAASSTVIVNLDTHGQIIYQANTAFGTDVGFADTVIGFENAIGGSNDDVLIGSGAANALTGGAGSDSLLGLGGRDILTGGVDGDTFIFGRLSDSGTTASTRDVITDFTTGGPGGVDKLDVSGIDAKTGGTDDDFTFIGRSNFGHHKGELRENFSNGDSIISGDVNGDGKADFSFLLKGHVLLDVGDFVL